MRITFISRLLIIILLTGAASLAYTQSLNKLSTDPKKHTQMLIGYCDRSGLEEDSFSSWYKKEYDSYIPDVATLNLLKKKMKNVKITLVMGTWCSDSKREVPRFMKIMDYLKYKTKRKNLTIICVDRDKNADNVDLKSLKIQLVPTMIFYKDGLELGRIIESPVESLEKDMLKYLSAAGTSKN